MANQVGLIISFIFLSIFIMFSYELTSYQKNTSQALIETNNIAMQIQKYGYDENTFQTNNYFKNVEVEVYETESLTEYKITTIKSYRCDINFFKFSTEDIVTSVYISSNIK